jgi:hypothetical protein
LASLHGSPPRGWIRKPVVKNGLKREVLDMGVIKDMFGKLFYIVKEMIYLIKNHKLWFIAPLLVMLALIAFLVYYIGPTLLVSFIYAGA